MPEVGGDKMGYWRQWIMYAEVEVEKRFDILRWSMLAAIDLGGYRWEVEVVLEFES